jgi:hypothetical protein
MKSLRQIHGYTLTERLDMGGSDRSFFRCKKKNKTYVLMKDEHAEQYVKLQQHLYDRHIAVPNVSWYDIAQHVVVLEDLGKESLYERTRLDNNPVDLYHRALDELIKLQIDGRPGAPIDRYYDYEHIRWEQDYFTSFFLHQYCKLPMERLSMLSVDFERLASTLLEEAAPITDFLMHRDYQSQNIYIKNGHIRIIDFQSARIGPLTYDLASLLRDAYVVISEKMEMRYIDYYLAALRQRDIVVEKKKFLELYHLTALQRIMQALGAFANLSLNKQKRHFRNYIPRAVQLLVSGLRDMPFQHLTHVMHEVTNRGTHR